MSIVTIAFSHLKTCSVNLPASWANSLYSKNIKITDVVVEVKWLNNQISKSKKSPCYFGWTGSSSTAINQQNNYNDNDGNNLVIEIDSYFGKSLGLRNGQKVQAQLVSNVQLTQSVNVEPLTEDDWEILELHANYIEEQFLNQIRIVFRDEIILIWIHQQTLIRMKIVDYESMAKCVKLDVNAEIIVSPKQRTNIEDEQAKELENEGEIVDSSSIVLRSYPQQFIKQYGSMNKDKNGMILPSNKKAITENITKIEDKINDTINSSTFNDNILGTINPIELDEAIDMNDISLFANENQIREIFPDFNEGDTMHFEILDKTYLNDNQNHLEDNENGESGNSNKDNTIGADLTSSNIENDNDDLQTLPHYKEINLILFTNKEVPRDHILISPELQCLLSIQPFDLIKLSLPKLKPVKKGNIIIHEILNSRLQQQANSDDRKEILISHIKYILSQSEITVSDGMCLKIKSPYDIYEETKEGEEKNLSEYMHVLISIVKNNSEVHASLDKISIDNNCYIELTRDNLSEFNIKVGKTLTDRRFIDWVDSTQKTYHFLGGVDDYISKINMFINCNLRYEKLRKQIHTPTQGGLLVCGNHGSGKTAILENICWTSARDEKIKAFSYVFDCDAYTEARIPNIIESWKQVFNQAAWYSPSIIIFENIDSIMPAEQENADMTRSQQLSELFIEIYSSYKKCHNILLVATAQQKTSVFSSLTNTNIFSEVINIMPPSKAQRQLIIKSIISEGNDIAKNSLPNLDVTSIAMNTEGYYPADLKVLIERATQEAIIGSINKIPANQIKITQDNFDKAQKDFVPVSLKGVKLQKSETEWKDIGGLKETKRTLLETLEWPTKYSAIFANSSLRLRSGLLLYGYPGCGKTLLASAVAKECGLNFISVKGPELLNKYIGASEKSVRDLFERAQSAKPCVLFFDEFDAIAPRRGHDNTGVTDRVVNQMLTQMDGAEGLDGVYVLAATSRPDLIDPALLRPGRLDKSLLCNMPDLEERIDILNALSRKLELGTSVDVRELAKKCEGYSGADLQALLYNAHLEAIHEQLNKVLQAANSNNDLSQNEKEKSVSFFVLKSKSEDDENHEVPMTLSQKSAIKSKIKTLYDNSQNKEDNIEKEEKETNENKNESKVYIEIEHIEKAYSTTRPSISEKERRRLEKIYEEYIGGKGIPTDNIGKTATFA
ncbi:AAA-domain-containing protein [Piromyces finnis]|uniref:Peroxisomal ATPase PEX1 n=1 Tax=Piromyces finnis TaxID=1754191 RepID=A0A1Y1V4N3_9FUNG|nr:AAA-domain-containing protein [Piromyces finnis]|eukprot:ORX46363.1 AAA-domain-containing protein [Piromyces finnis]